jgi:predicted transcriptional regulator
MKNRFFWEKATLKKFRVTFETNEIVIGATRRNKYKTFRKDTGVIAFSRRELLDVKLAKLRGKAERMERKLGVTGFNNPGLDLGFDQA